MPLNPPRRRRIALPLALVLTLGLAPAATWSAVDPKAGRLYEEALGRYERQDLDGAVLQLKNALQADKSLLPAHVLLGKILLSRGEASAAEAALNQALTLGVSRAEVVTLLARALVIQGRQKEVVDPQRFPQSGLPAGVRSQLLLIQAGAFSDLGDARAALKAIEEARQLTPATADVWLAEVPVRVRSRQFAEALRAVDKARTLDPGSAEVHYQHGSILHVQGDRAGALAAYGKALAAQSNHGDARVARAGLYLDLRQPEAAAKDVEVLVEKSPRDPRGWYLSALLAERDNQTQRLQHSLRRITELLDPVPLEFIRYRPQMLLLNGQAHYGLGEREKAKPLFEAFQRVQPGSPVAKLLASMYLAEGKADAAIDLLEQYRRVSPQDDQALALLASAHMAKGSNARAAALMQEALRSKDSAELHSAYGLSLIGAGKAGDALAALETAYRKDPNQTQAAYALVGLYLRAGQAAKALNLSQTLVARQPGNAGLHNLLGMAKAQSRDTAGARSAFEQAIKLDPGMHQASLNLARLEIASKNHDRAQALLDALLKADERNTEAMYEQAMLAERRGKADDALRWLQRAFDVAGSKDLRSSLSLVDLHMRQGRPQEALKVALQVAAGLPDDLRVLLALARVQLANADLVNARASLTSATRVANYDPAIQVEIALLQIAAQNLPGAAYCLDKALSSKADYLPALVLLTEVETRQGEFTKAEQRAQQILKREPRQAIGHSLLGDLATARKQPAQAVEAYRKAHQVQPSAETMGRLFRALAAQDLKAAIALAGPWLKAHPDDGATRQMLAEAHVRSGNMAAARQAYEQLRERLPKDPGVLNNLANVLLRLQDPQAMPVAEQALAADPNNPVTIDTAGWIALQTGNLDRAMVLLRDARLRRPDSAEIRYHLAAALAKAGRKVEARDELEAALRSQPDFDGRREAEALLRTLK